MPHEIKDPLTDYLDEEYIVFSGLKTILLPSFDFSPCEPVFTETITCMMQEIILLTPGPEIDLINNPPVDSIDTVNPWIKQVGNTIEISTTDVSLHGEFVITVTSTIPRPPSDPD